MTTETIQLPYGLQAVVHLREPNSPTAAAGCAACEREPAIWISEDGTPLCASCLIDGCAS